MVCLIVSLLSPHLQFEPLSVEGKTPATAVLLLGSPEEDILVKACEAIHTFADKGEAGLPLLTQFTTCTQLLLFFPSKSRA